jgi:hypothetical protein
LKTEDCFASLKTIKKLRDFRVHEKIYTTENNTVKLKFNFNFTVFITNKLLGKQYSEKNANLSMGLHHLNSTGTSIWWPKSACRRKEK